MLLVLQRFVRLLKKQGFGLVRVNRQPELRDALNNRTGKLPLDGSLIADLTQIRQWSWWITPDTEPKRYDTRFFVCVVPYEPDVVILPDASKRLKRNG